MRTNKHIDVNIESFIEKGYEKINVFLILRDTSEGMLQFEEGGVVNLPNEFDSFFPFGNPPSFFAGMGIKNEKVYVSVFVAKNISINLMLETKLTQHFYNPLLFLKSLKQEMETALSQIKATNSNKINLSFALYTESPMSLPKMQGLDSIFYSVMSKLPVMIIGENEEILNFLVKLVAALPPEIQKITSFKFNIEYEENDNIGIYATNPKYLDLYSSLLNQEHQIIDIVDLRNNLIYSNYEVKALRTILEKTDYNIEPVKMFLTDIYKTALKATDTSDPSKIVDEFKVDYDLADLIIDTHKALKKIKKR